MSIDINWSVLTNPSSTPSTDLHPPTPSQTDDPFPNDLALSIRDFIHAKFQTLTLPRFIRRVNVHDFDFGAEAPEVRLLDVTDPLGEFYDSEDDEDDDDEEEEEEALNEQVQDAGERKSNSVAAEADRLGRVGGAAAAAAGAAPPRSVPAAVTPGLGIGAGGGGGGGGFGYFHLPALNPSAHGILSGTATPFSPSPWAAPGPAPAPPHPPPRSSHAPSQIPTSPTPSKSKDRDLDLQTTLHIKYDGTMSLGLTAEVMLDYPMPSFVGIPLELRICGVRFDGVGVVAYLRGRGGGGGGKGGGAEAREIGADREEDTRGKVKFCFLGEEEARLLLAGEEEGGDGEGEKTEGREEGPVGGGLLKEIRIESEIGRKGEGKQVLKNVGKVERFVLEQVRRIFEEEFVWPSFWTVLV